MTGPRTPRGARPRVFIVDDHGLFRSGVRMELGTDVDVIGEAADVDSAVEQIGAEEPDVVLLDVHLPGGGGQAVVSATELAHVPGAEETGVARLAIAEGHVLQAAEAA